MDAIIFAPTAPFRLRGGKAETLPSKAWLKRLKKLTAQGIKEINLTGVNIGDFGKSTGESFLDLLKALEQTKELVRIRMGSVEPNLLSDEIITFVANSTKLAPHFHIPLQAGTDEVLELMKRKYNTALFQQRVAAIRKQLPYAFIGVDVIAGMNGESDELFEKAFHFIKNLEVSQLHAFPLFRTCQYQSAFHRRSCPYKRAKIQDSAANTVIRKKLHQFYRNNLGRTATVLFENQHDINCAGGWTENYIKVETPTKTIY